MRTSIVLLTGVLLLSGCRMLPQYPSKDVVVENMYVRNVFVHDSEPIAFELDGVRYQFAQQPRFPDYIPAPVAFHEHLMGEAAEEFRKEMREQMYRMRLRHIERVAELEERMQQDHILVRRNRSVYHPTQHSTPYTR